MMPEDFRIIGSGRHSPGSDEDFRGRIREALQQHGRPPEPLAYKPGSWGPDAAIELPSQPGWRLPEEDGAG